jgi:hypothetical protein
MFIGHFAVGLASKTAAPRSSLGWLMAAPVMLDLLWPVFLLLGIERVRIAPGDTAFTPLAFESYPWSHSLLMTVIWASLFGGAYFLATRYARGAVVIGLGVLSHWVMDAITHRPDLPLAPGSATMVGYGLWDSPAATLMIEIGIFAAAVWLYMRTTVARDRIGRYSFAVFVFFALAMYAAVSEGPPPPSVTAVAWGSLTLFLVPLWAAWFDAHRLLRTQI